VTEFYSKNGEPLDLGVAVPVPNRTQTDQFLGWLGLPYKMEDIVRSARARHEAIDCSFGYLASEGTPKAVEMVQTFLTAEVRHADPSNPRHEKYVDEAFDIVMGCFPNMRPTLSFITPKTVELLRDDRLASRYLELMLADDASLENWQPVVDWAALDWAGGVSGVDAASSHNTDIATMHQWSDRFSYHRVGHLVMEKLDVIESQLHGYRQVGRPYNSQVV
jgi:hypothetical protein